MKQILDTIPFDKDLSMFPIADLYICKKFLRRGWKKPLLWHIIIPAYIAIVYEIEWRKAGS